MISRERYAFAEEGVGEAVQRLLATPEPLGEDWDKLDTSGDRIHGELRDSVGSYGLTLVATAPGIAKTAQIAGFAEAAAAAGVPVAIVGGNAASVRTLNRELGGTELTVLSVQEYLASLGRGEAADKASDAEDSSRGGPDVGGAAADRTTRDTRGADGEDRGAGESVATPSAESCRQRRRSRPGSGIRPEAEAEPHPPSPNPPPPSSPTPSPASSSSPRRTRSTPSPWRPCSTRSPRACASCWPATPPSRARPARASRSAT